jgi:hypothetical protein
MSRLEKFFGLDTLKSTKEQKQYLRRSFESNILIAAFLSGKISLQKYKELISKKSRPE